MRSRDKIDVFVEAMPQYGNKKWMKVRIKWALHEPNVLVPSFEDWYRMIRALVECERDKYKFHHDPGRLTREFFMRCFDLAEAEDEETAWEALRKEFGIPRR